MTNPYNPSAENDENASGFPQADSNPTATPAPASFAGAGDSSAAYLDSASDAGEPRQWAVALLLAFFIGGFGAHNFYLGYKKRAIIQVSLTIIGLLTSLIIIGLLFLFAVGIWVLVEFIMILVKSDYVDAWGRPLVRK